MTSQRAARRRSPAISTRCCARPRFRTIRRAERPPGGAHAGPCARVAVAVDSSLRTIQGAIDAGANLLIVHHGLFWSALQPLRGPRLRAHSPADRQRHRGLLVAPSARPAPDARQQRAARRRSGSSRRGLRALSRSIDVGVAGDCGHRRPRRSSTALRAIARARGRSLVTRRRRRRAVVRAAGRSAPAPALERHAARSRRARHRHAHRRRRPAPHRRRSAGARHRRALRGPLRHGDVRRARARRGARATFELAVDVHRRADRALMTDAA